ncbi:MAG: enoyl-CoA hydratase [Deltaproteobacteria bacterium]|nr:enoyl-CoA hydratase [Deltaproteobacteria bacterium]
MVESTLLIDKSEGIATLTLNRPEAMNALSRTLRTEIVQAFTSLQHDPEVGVIILTGAGRAFCAGMDLKELGSTNTTLNNDTVGGELDIIQAMTNFDRPIIGAINGFAITGGFELALACDVLIASTAAKFADTHARVGVMPGWGLSQKLPRIIGLYRAKELSLTGNFLSAEQAAAWGLVNRVVTPEELLPTCRALAKDMQSCVPEMLRNLKRVIDEGFAATLSEGLQIEHQAWQARVRQVTPEAIAERRNSIQQRGRRQSS